jgi:hypothetical protein
MAAMNTDALILPTLCLNTDAMMLLAVLNTDTLLPMAAINTNALCLTAS